MKKIFNVLLIIVIILAFWYFVMAKYPNNNLVVKMKSLIGIENVSTGNEVSGDKINNEWPKICTMEYAPVCGKVNVQCVKAPCNPVEQTFGNKCTMEANKLAEFLYTWECKTTKPNLSNCEAYFDGCNNCSVVNWKVSACTMMYCETPGEPKCTKEKSKNNVGIANPASVNCEDNGWTLEIKDETGWQIGICNFPDGSSCEEWAFMRGECKKGDNS